MAVPRRQRRAQACPGALVCGVTPALPAQPSMAAAPQLSVVLPFASAGAARPRMTQHAARKRKIAAVSPKHCGLRGLAAAWARVTACV